MRGNPAFTNRYDRRIASNHRGSSLSADDAEPPCAQGRNCSAVMTPGREELRMMTKKGVLRSAKGTQKELVITNSGGGYSFSCFSAYRRNPTGFLLSVVLLE